jgi:hypothetical protein
MCIVYVITVCVVVQAQIRKELNDFKSKEMDVHEESRHLTRYVSVVSSSFSTCSMIVIIRLLFVDLVDVQSGLPGK